MFNVHSKMKVLVIVLITLGLPLAGCMGGLASSSVQTSSKVGIVKSVSKMDPDKSFQVTNRHAKFYKSLAKYGKKDWVIADYADAKITTLGAISKYVTESGTYYHMVAYDSGGFEKFKDAMTSTDYDAFDDFGVIKAEDVKQVNGVKSQWTYKKRRPYYIADPFTHRIWDSPIYTKHYTYISHVFDRLTQTQLYATKELIKRNGIHYVFLETANKKLGWVYKSPKVLIKGKYCDIGKQLLKVKTHDKLIKKQQSAESTKSRVGVNDSLSVPQRAYIVRNNKRKISQLLVVGMDNRPIKIAFKNGRLTKMVGYTYRRTVWKTITNRKKLTSSYYLAHDSLDIATTDVKFYPKSSKLLVRVKTIGGGDGSAKTLIYRNGKVKFSTHIYKHVLTYPYANFK
ncbi:MULTISPECIES: hypothetical protein [Levilactobacillus]|uniref:hypothetical protein n=2 Tax=Lactobacillaceae TaxID=33958 RepID=UPI00195039E6|nr:hypothetical protein [Levilactobacillus sp. 244-2]